MGRQELIRVFVDVGGGKDPLRQINDLLEEGCLIVYMVACPPYVVVLVEHPYQYGRRPEPEPEPEPEEQLKE